MIYYETLYFVYHVAGNVCEDVALCDLKGSMRKRHAYNSIFILCSMARLISFLVILNYIHFQ